MATRIQDLENGRVFTRPCSRVSHVTCEHGLVLKMMNQSSHILRNIPIRIVQRNVPPDFSLIVVVCGCRVCGRITHNGDSVKLQFLCLRSWRRVVVLYLDVVNVGATQTDLLVCSSTLRFPNKMVKKRTTPQRETSNSYEN